MKRLLLPWFILALPMASCMAQFSDNPDKNLQLTFQETYSSEAGTLADGRFYVTYNAPVGNDIYYYLMFFDKEGNSLWDEPKLVSSKQTKLSFNTNQMLYVDKDENALLICPNSQFDPSQTQETYTVYKVDKEGNDLWPAEGINLMGKESKRALAMVSVLQLADGSYVFSWTESSPGNDYKYRVRLQRLSESGEALWGEGKVIEDEIEGVSDPYLVDAGNNEVIIVYSRGTQQYIYADRLDFEGNSLWGEPTLVYGGGGFGSSPLWTILTTCPAEGGVVVGWHGDPEGSSYESVYISYIKADGSYGFATGAEGLKLNYSDLRAFNPSIAYDDANDLIYVAWRETSGLQDRQGILTQLVSLQGELLWNPNDEERQICPVDDYQASYQSAMIGPDGTYATFYMVNFDDFKDVKVFACLQDGEGNALWENSPITLSDYESRKGSLYVTNYNQDQWICFWDDERTVTDTAKYDISHLFAQNVGIGGNLGNGGLAVEQTLATDQGNFHVSIFPNPVSQDAVIRIDGIPSPGSLEMSLYDIQGRRVDYRETKVQDSEIRLDYRRPAHLVPGMYILLVEMDSERFMRKMILK